MRNFWIVGVIIFFFSCAKQPIEVTENSNNEKLPIDKFGKASKQDTTLNPLSTIFLLEAAQAKHLDNINKAIDLYNQAIQIDRNNDAAHFELANIYQSQNFFDIDKALLNIRQAYTINPKNELYQIILGRLLVDTNQTDEGVQLFENLTTANPKRKDYAFDLAYAYEKANRMSDAIEVFNSIESTYGYDPEINYQKHILYFKLGDKEKGIAEIEEIVDQNPEYITYSLFVAEHYINIGDFAKAENYAMKAYIQEPTNADAFSILLYTYANQNNERAFEDLLLKLIASDQSVDQKVFVLKDLFDLFRQKPSLQSPILEASKLLVNQYPKRAEPFALLGDFLYLSEQDIEAISAYKKSLAIRKDVYDVWAQVMDIYVYSENYQELAVFAEQASLQFPKKAFPTYMAGYANFRNQNYSKTIRVLESVSDKQFENNDYDIPILILLADAYQKNNQYDESYLTYDKVLLQDPDNAHVLNNYSYYLGEQKKQLDKAKKMAARALELNPEDANTLDTYGWVLFQKGEFVEAEKVLQQAVNGNPNSAIIIEHYGDVLFYNQKIKEAIIQWEKALKLDVTNTKLRSKIEQNQ